MWCGNPTATARPILGISDFIGYGPACQDEWDVSLFIADKVACPLSQCRYEIFFFPRYLGIWYHAAVGRENSNLAYYMLGHIFL